MISYKTPPQKKQKQKKQNEQTNEKKTTKKTSNQNVLPVICVSMSDCCRMARL